MEAQGKETPTFIIDEKLRVIVQKWEESERGWGVKPDGYSLHLNDFARQRFIKEYWNKMPDEIPGEYSRPSGTPYTCEVDKETFEKVRTSGNGIRQFGTPPGSQGIDGWKTVPETTGS